MADPTPAEVARERRATIERDFNNQREQREKTYKEARENLENEFRNDMKAIDQAKREFFLAEGLNADGSDPQGRPQG
jgi:hypothetical protein